MLPEVTVYERSKRSQSCTSILSGAQFLVQVQGSERQPLPCPSVLHQTLPLIADATCSCPMGGMCKHSAALLLHAIRIGLVGSASTLCRLPIEAHPVGAFSWAARATTTITIASRRWVTSLTEALSDNDSATQSSPHIDSVLYFLDVSQDQACLNLRAVHARRLKAGGFGHTQSSGARENGGQVSRLCNRGR
jgi:hypothetical protein